MAADRELLFGVLALQVGLIDQGELVDGLRSWTGDRSRSLAEHMAEGGCLGPDDRSEVEAMVGRLLGEHGGDVGRCLAAVHVDPAATIELASIGDRELSATLDAIGPGADRPPDRPVTFELRSDAVGDRFRLLRPHAHGGLGVVSVALDTELNREVALKQIVGRLADDPVSRSRFLVEAEVTGGLEHPNIAPVYSLGTDAEGRPYYAMRLIRGRSLREAIARHHDEPGDPARRSIGLRQLLRRFLDVCNAVEYAPQPGRPPPRHQARQRRPRRARRDPGRRLGPGQGPRPQDDDRPTGRRRGRCRGRATRRPTARRSARRRT